MDRCPAACSPWRWSFRPRTRRTSPPSETARSSLQIFPIRPHRRQWREVPRCRQPSDWQSVFIVANKLIIGQMLVDPRQRVEIGKYLGKDTLAARNLLLAWRHPLKAVEHGPSHRDVNGFSGALGKLPHQAIGLFIIDDDSHRMIHVFNTVQWI